MTDDRLGDVYYDASRSDETVSLKGLRAVADAAERRVLDDLAEIIDSNLNIQRSTLVGFVVRKREERDRGDG